ncbi:MAG: 30S ribosomal protein S20 [Armatimonadota bacterium]|nr:30S ribosomal protein S20 [Armatimonadota bacterium]MDR7402072.1 30S ribosomal protein S20 [Armatimonadota bacterium]MDR7404005.1 30S ribosomal protein S20 [Armatimonadota bacterium]MDR7437102.1 30S ribosomal protein S20 [Armatimonadota bacterium]MDR7472447.1 30S ribosomal protein S20 [Armatimonadota bacterium]
MAKRLRSGLKHQRKSEKRRLRNQSVRTRLKTLTKKALADPRLLPLVQAEFDRAARKGIIHPNKAARRKSRLMRRLAAAAATP